MAATVAAAVEAGLAGCNIEDSEVGGDPALIDAEHACDRLGTAREAVARARRPFVLNRRTTPYLVRRGEGAAGGNFAVGARAGREAALTVSELDRLGVQQISAGGGLALAAMGFVRGALARIQRGVFEFGAGAPTNAEMSRLMPRLAPVQPSCLHY